METLEKRGYQVKSVAPAVSALQTIMRALIVMATGLGKTILCGMIINEYFKHKSSFRILYLCDKSIGLSQSEQEFLGKMQMQIEAARMYGDHNAKVSRRGKTITFASFQKLNSAREWYKQFSRDHFDLIVVDEAHYAFAPTYYEVIKYFANNGKTPLLGMTATPYRSDQKDIRQLFGEPVVNIPLEDGIAMGALADFTYSINADDLDESKLDSIIRRELKGQRRRPTIKSLNTTLFIKKRDQEIVKQIKYETRNGEKTLVFCKSIAQANRFAELLGPKAKPYHSKIDKKANAAVLEDFKTGNTKYLLTVDKLNEAFDMPEVEVIVFLRSTSSRRIFMQQLGRGLRKNREKKIVKILDFAGNCERLIMLATLVDNMKKAQERVGAAMDGPMVSKKRRTASTTQRVYDLKGEHYNFVFTHKVVKMLDLIRVIRDGFYGTLGEAKKAAQSLGIRTAKEYYLECKKDLRLPVFPEKVYRSSWTTWDDFLDTQVADDEWKTAGAIELEARGGQSGADSRTVAKIAESYRPSHPEWFKRMRPRHGKHSEHFHPRLVKIIFTRLQSRVFAPEGWSTVGILARSKGLSFGLVKTITEKYRKQHPEWFCYFESLRRGRGSEHIHSDLVNRVQEDLQGKLAPKSWMVAIHIKTKYGLSQDPITITNYAEQFRTKHSKWFMSAFSHARLVTYFHPRLARKIANGLMARKTRRT